MAVAGQSTKAGQIREMGGAVLPKPFPAETQLAALARVLQSAGAVAGQWGW